MVRTVCFIMIVIILSSCGSLKKSKSNLYDDRAQEINLELVTMLSVGDISLSNTNECIGIVDDKIFYMSERNDKVIIKFIDYYGNLVNRIIIDKGKGPGEVLGVQIIKYYDNKLYILDSLNKISIFADNGEYIDCFYVNECGDTPFSFQVMNDDVLYISGQLKTNILKIKNGSGDIIKKKVFENIDFSHGAFFNGGPIALDCEKKILYRGFYSSPYRLDIYDLDLNLQKTIFYDLPKNIHGTKWYIDNIVDVSGYHLISSIHVDKRYLYLPPISGYEITHQGDKGLKGDFKIYLINNKSYNCDYILYYDKIKIVKDIAGVFSINNDYIYTFIYDREGELNHKFFGNNQAGNIIIIIFKKPSL